MLAIIPINDLWLRLRALSDTVGDERYLHIERRLLRYFRPFFPFSLVQALRDLSFELGELSLLNPVAPDWLPEIWLEWCEFTGRATNTPLDVEIRLYPGVGEQTREEDPLREIQSLMLEVPASLTFAVRPLSIAYSGSRGYSVWQDPTSPGTLGGLLKINGVDMATTSAHVATQIHAPVWHRAGRQIAHLGRCCYLPHHEVNLALLTPVFVDETALIQLDIPAEDLPMQKVDGYLRKDDVPRHLPLRVVGATGTRSDIVAYQWVANRDVKIGSEVWTISDGMELRRPAVGLSGETYRRPTRPGDSGAWILLDSVDRAEWCGSVVGGDAVSSVATFAEHTVDAITRDLPPGIIYLGDDSGRPLNSAISPETRRIQVGL